MIIREYFEARSERLSRIYVDCWKCFYRGQENYLDVYYTVIKRSRGLVFAVPNRTTISVPTFSQLEKRVKERLLTGLRSHYVTTRDVAWSYNSLNKHKRIVDVVCTLWIAFEDASSVSYLFIQGVPFEVNHVIFS